MSLTVSAWTSGSPGTALKGEALSGPLAAGLENWRTKVWGSPQVRALGAEYFPRLSGADLHVEAGEITAFLGECALLREQLSLRLANIEAAARRALEAGGQVVIW